MPVNLTLPQHHPVPGVQLASIAAGIKKDGSADLVLIKLPENSVACAVFTQNHFAAAPVRVAKSNLQATGGAVRALLINSGNANAGTGAAGIAMAQGHCQAAAQSLGLSAAEVLPFSTGVIGEPLPDDIIRQGIDVAAATLGDDWAGAATGIMTTDTVPKISSTKFACGDQTITITGMVKGAGMIQPNMATMLAYFFTDAAIDKSNLQVALEDAVAHSFNAVTVDSDTSTNDACVLIATGSGPSLEPGDATWPDFVKALNGLMLLLAQSLVRDGEGATKFISVHVRGAATDEAASKVAFSVANSPLVKTAIFASDANVGRILMAIGKAEVSDIDQNVVSVSLGEHADTAIFNNGVIDPDYTEARGASIFAKEDIDIHIDLSMGSSNKSVYTSDLSHDYVSINADYRS